MKAASFAKTPPTFCLPWNLVACQPCRVVLQVWLGPVCQALQEKGCKECGEGCQTFINLETLGLSLFEDPGTDHQGLPVSTASLIKCDSHALAVSVRHVCQGHRSLLSLSWLPTLGVGKPGQRKTVFEVHLFSCTLIFRNFGLWKKIELAAVERLMYLQRTPLMPLVTPLMPLVFTMLYPLLQAHYQSSQI